MKGFAFGGILMTIGIIAIIIMVATAVIKLIVGIISAIIWLIIIGIVWGFLKSKFQND